MATSRDYLEKIFQIPFWLNPMTPTSTVKLLNGILGESVVKEVTEKPTANRSAATRGAAGEQADHLKEATGESASQPQAQSIVEQAGSVNETQHPRSGLKLEKFDLNPKSLDMREREIKFMESLAPILGRSPRSVKRFINIYRLIKVSRSPVGQREFLKVKQPIARYQAVMLLLVIETSLPAISGELFSILQSDYQVHIPNGDLNGLLNYLIGDNAENRDEVERLQEWLKKSHNEILGDLELSHLAEWAPLISRYSFNSERT